MFLRRKGFAPWRGDGERIDFAANEASSPAEHIALRGPLVPTIKLLNSVGGCGTFVPRPVVRVANGFVLSNLGGAEMKQLLLTSTIAATWLSLGSISFAGGLPPAAWLRGHPARASRDSLCRTRRS